MKNQNDYLTPEELLSYILRYKLIPGKNEKGEFGYKLTDWVLPPTEDEIEEQFMLWQNVQTEVDNHVEKQTENN